MSSVDEAQYELSVEDDGSDLQMPNVFITPPEEDRVPPWCCFDAANPSFSQLIEHHRQPKEISPIAFHPDEAYYTSMGDVNDGPTTTTVVDDAMAPQHHDFEDDIETISDYGHELEDEGVHSAARDVGNDSDVVEIVKLRRLDRLQDAEQDFIPKQPSQTMKSASLKSKASRAFKSLAGSLRSKSRTRDIVSSSSSRSSSQKERDSVHSRQEPAPPTSRSRTPTALRRGTVVLSQLFTTPIKTRSSMSSFDDSALNSPTSQKFSVSESATSAQSQLLPSSSLYSYEPSLQDQSRLAAASPAPTISSRKSSSRFSMLSLQRLFSFGSATPITAQEEEVEHASNLTNNTVQPEDPEMTTATPVLRSAPSTPAFSSSSSTSGPETPTSVHYQIPVRLVTGSSNVDGAPEFPAFDTFDALFDSSQNLNLGLGLGLNLPADGTSSGQRTEHSTPRKSVWGSRTPKGRKKSTQADSSLEMQLDSFHFDSLSFDVDRF